MGESLQGLKLLHRKVQERRDCFRGSRVGIHDVQEVARSTTEKPLRVCKETLPLSTEECKTDTECKERDSDGDDRKTDSSTGGEIRG